jgi:integrase
MPGGGEGDPASGPHTKGEAMTRAAEEGTMTDPRQRRGATTSLPATERRDFGTIRRQKASRFWWIRYRVGGKTYEESSGSENYKAAEKLLARRQAELGLGQFTAPDVKRTTFEDLAQLIRDDYVVNHRRSTKRMELSLKHLTAAFAGTRAAAIRPDRLNRYVRERQEAGVAPATIRNELNALRHAFRLAKRAGRAANVPEFPSLKAANIRTGFFEPDDFPGLLTELPDYVRPVVEFAAFTGWRVPSEVLPLTWDRVDFAAGVVTLDVGSTKTGEGRTFPFAALPPLRALLERQRERATAYAKRTGQLVPWVFHHDGARIQEFYTAWHGACRRASIVKRGNLEEVVRPALLGRVPHDFRRTAVRNLVRAGVPEHIAMKLTGHKTRDIFDRYDIVSERDLSEGVAKLAQFHAAVGVGG